MDRDREFGEFVDARALVMRRTAYLLCGDWHRAEDIVQTALIKMYVAWSRVRKDSVDAYARKVLVRTAIDETRRGFFQRERSVDAVPERAVPDSTFDLDLREVLDMLPPGQRAVVVLRYWEDLSITETARILGRTEGTVKSQAAKGLAALRGLLEDEPELRIYRSEVIRKGKTKLVRRRTAIATALAFVLVAGFGTAGYLVRPRETATSAPPSASTVWPQSADHNAELTRILRDSNIIPASVTAHDVAWTKALQFYNVNGPERRMAVARLTDAAGTSGLLLDVSADGPASVTCNGGEECRYEEVDGVKIVTFVIRMPGTGQMSWRAEAHRPDGTHVSIWSDNVGSFRADLPFTQSLDTSVGRPEPVLGREALIKIATLPGFTF
ncbi:SigE family RNA polymerase sigma factor [Lentzea sp. NBC_00516]|uniref:SigE family RNA polymerase sigma factor n=1 Tax=Lentzea sp. NBC_00516 TaxID=2903582 RepID=UPI002E821DC5|nr:SigE family RNA polymerase sigma factor [Lentzea sp. NBC_00516]